MNPTIYFGKNNHRLSQNKIQKNFQISELATESCCEPNRLPCNTEKKCVFSEALNMKRFLFQD